MAKGKPMTDRGRVVTTMLPDDMVSRLDEAAERLDRTKSWIVREALGEWLEDERRREQLNSEV